MFGVYVSVATLLFAILGAVWKLSSVISVLDASVKRLEKSIDNIGATVVDTNQRLENHEARITRTEHDVGRLQDDAA